MTQSHYRYNAAKQLRSLFRQRFILRLEHEMELYPLLVRTLQRLRFVCHAGLVGSFIIPRVTGS